MDSKIMAIAAHPGDALFTMGATVAQHIHNGGQGVFLSLTLGEKGSLKIPTREYGEMQRAATEKGGAILGASARFLTYPDAELPLNDRVAFEVCDLIREERPNIIVTHWNGSWHKDHQNCHLIVRDAIFYAGLRTVERKLPAHYVGRLFFADNWEDASNFVPDVFLDISDVFEKWLEACAAFPMWKGENGFRYNDYYRSLAVARGCLAGYDKAVALMSEPGQRVIKTRAL